MSALPKANLTDHFDPMAIGMLNRVSPGIVRAAFGDDVARSNPPISLAEAMSTVWSRSNPAAVGRRPDISAMLTTDDLRRIITDTVAVSALASYITGYPPIMQISHETRDIENFKPVEKVAGGMFPQLLPPGEAGEVQYGSIGERGESYSAAMMSRMIELTVEALKNDNLGLLVQPALRIGDAVLDTKARVLVNLITSNPVLSDSVAVFHASHGNLAASSSRPSDTSLSAARLAMRRQKDVDGERGIGVEPAFLVVPPELETESEQLLMSITANTTAENNPFAGKLKLVVDHRLTDPLAWYVFTRPERQMSLEHGSVDGMDDPEIRTDAPINRHSVITRVAIAFGAGWVDFRGAYKNPGSVSAP